jgi:hypothetical protein
MSSLSPNPLAKHFRQPALYIKLPSQGRWYPEGEIDISASNEIPVYPMTARDEIMMKTPDALMNGASTIQVIQSCCPSIKDPGNMPIVDLDAVLLGIRLATYGPEMEFTTVCPHCNTKAEKALNVSILLEKIVAGDWSHPIKVAGVEITLKPQNYREFNNNNQINFEEQRILQLVQNEEIPAEEKTKKFDEMFAKLVETGISQVSKNIASIKTADGDVVSNPDYIKEFLDNCEKSVWNAVRDRLDLIKKQNNYNEINLECENEECSKQFIAPFVFEQSNFFA